MQKILVFGSRQDGAPEVRQMIERELPYQIFEASNEDDLKAQIEQLVFSAVVVVTGKKSDCAARGLLGWQTPK